MSQVNQAVVLKFDRLAAGDSAVAAYATDIIAAVKAAGIAPDDAGLHALYRAEVLPLVAARYGARLIPKDRGVGLMLDRDAPGGAAASQFMVRVGMILRGVNPYAPREKQQGSKDPAAALKKALDAAAKALGTCLGDPETRAEARKMGAAHVAALAALLARTGAKAPKA